MSHIFQELIDSQRGSGKIQALPVFLLSFLILSITWAVQTPNVLAQEDIATEASPYSLPVATEPDTLRSNAWLTEALMAEIVASTAYVLPATPAAIQLVQQKGTIEDDLFQAAVIRVLGGLGYDVYFGDDDPAKQPAVDCIYSFEVHGIELEYPVIGRTLGLWRRWIDRELKVTVLVNLSMANSGRMLLSDRIQRRFSDRVPDEYFDLVESDLYAFTTAETPESGWISRVEEIVVLGTLAGLVAVYFANTGD